MDREYNALHAASRDVSRSEFVPELRSPRITAAKTVRSIRGPLLFTRWLGLSKIKKRVAVRCHWPCARILQIHHEPVNISP